MKKASIQFLLLFVIFAFSSFSQTTTSSDFYAGKWEITISGTPQGDSKMIADLVQKDGKLTGDITTTGESSGEKISITRIDESGDKLSLFFTAQGFDVSLELTKVDDDTMKGTMMSMFDATAKRLK